ncbi:hypothetical protein EVAR_91445_1 [Eumeta japonica]|uniref:Uncharacterized protein n=1 Tax=Eumeta variegata TaxID=151549 RepID=A0A4C1X0V2_EUMVA|nr:hypothetical protein EVAR_91445_1 [Eumeta japonica]
MENLMTVKNLHYELYLIVSMYPRDDSVSIHSMLLKIADQLGGREPALRRRSAFARPAATTSRILSASNGEPPTLTMVSVHKAGDLLRLSVESVVIIRNPVSPGRYHFNSLSRHGHPSRNHIRRGPTVKLRSEARDSNVYVPLTRLPNKKVSTVICEQAVNDVTSNNKADGGGSDRTPPRGRHPRPPRRRRPPRSCACLANYSLTSVRLRTRAPFLVKIELERSSNTLPFVCENEMFNSPSAPRPRRQREISELACQFDRAVSNRCRLSLNIPRGAHGPPSPLTNFAARALANLTCVVGVTLLLLFVKIGRDVIAHEFNDTGSPLRNRQRSCRDSVRYLEQFIKSANGSVVKNAIFALEDKEFDPERTWIDLFYFLAYVKLNYSLRAISVMSCLRGARAAAAPGGRRRYVIESIRRRTFSFGRRAVPVPRAARSLSTNR